MAAESGVERPDQAAEALSFDEDLLEALKVFDFSGKGYISSAALSHVVNKLDIDLPAEEVAEATRIAMMHSNDRMAKYVNYKHFVREVKVRRSNSDLSSSLIDPETMLRYLARLLGCHIMYFSCFLDGRKADEVPTPALECACLPVAGKDQALTPSEESVAGEVAVVP